MKLKKIASLMLAGIMAVSMLAACGEGKDNGGNAGSSSSQPATTGVVAAVENAIKAKNSGLTVSVKESTPLNLQLKALFDQEENTYEKLGLGSTAGSNVVRTKINDVLGWNMSTNNSLLSDSSSFSSSTIGSHYYNAVIPVEKIAGMDATAYAADQIAEKFVGLSNSTGTNAGSAQKVSYTMYVSAQTAVKANGNEVPVLIAALEVKVENKL